MSPPSLWEKQMLRAIDLDVKYVAVQNKNNRKPLELNKVINDLNTLTPLCLHTGNIEKIDSIQPYPLDTRCKWLFLLLFLVSHRIC